MKMRKGEKHVRQKLSREERLKNVVLTDLQVYMLDWLIDNLDMTQSEILRAALEEYFDNHAECTREELKDLVAAEEEAWRNFDE